MDRITRHPMLFSMAALGLSFGLKSGVFARVLGLGIFPGIMAVVGGAHQDWRYVLNLNLYQT
jgi:protein-S-isoprenylcysteine O-methyltransferase Ste14